MLGDEIGQVDVLLIIIGPSWASLMKQRLNDPNDFVRFELQNALKQSKRVIPLLVDGAVMPTEAEFEGGIPSDFFYLNAAYLSRGKNFTHDLESLIAELRKLDVPIKRPVSKLPILFGVVIISILTIIGLLIDLRLKSDLPTSTPTTFAAQALNQTSFSQTIVENTLTDVTPPRPEPTLTKTNSPTHTSIPTNTHTLTHRPSDIPTSTLSPTAILIPIVIINVAEIPMYSESSTNGQIITRLKNGDQLRLISRYSVGDKEWYWIESENGIRGYVYYLTAITSQVTTITQPVTIVIAPSTTAVDLETVPTPIWTSFPEEVIITAPGSYLQEIGCQEDWQPGCTFTRLYDFDADGIYERTFNLIPPGDYEVKIAINWDWEENYGLDGIRDGSNIPFSLGVGESVTITFDFTTKYIDIKVTKN